VWKFWQFLGLLLPAVSAPSPGEIAAWSAAPSGTAKLQQQARMNRQHRLGKRWDMDQFLMTST
jgi:hypothetical protein